jgi:glycine/D-amino acid oxidase-like deaminating enzyme
LNVDVVIVGGGITGAICSYLFAGAGASVALVEAAKVGRGSTVASTALLMQEPDRDLGDLRRRFGGPAAVEIWGVLRRATRELVATLGRLKVAGLSECESV